MATITTRAGKGSPLTNTEVDDNFSNLNSAKYESGASPTFGVTQITGSNDVGLRVHSSDTASAINMSDTGGSVNLQNYQGALKIRTNGTHSTYSGTIEMAKFSTSGIVLNEGSYDADFRVESNDNANMLFVDASTNRVGIGNAAPSTTLEVTGNGDAETGITVAHSRAGVGNTILLNNTNNGANKGSGIKWKSGGFTTGAIITRSDAVAASGDAPAYMTFHTSSDGSEDLTERLRLSSTGAATFSGLISGPSLQVTGNAIGSLGSAFEAFVASDVVYTGALDRASGDYRVLKNSANRYEWLTGTTTSVSTEVRLALNLNGAITTTPDAGGNTVFNEGGVDADFRVESDANSHMLFVDSGNNKIGINESHPAASLDIRQSTNGNTDGILVRPVNESQSMIYSFLGMRNTYFTHFVTDSANSGQVGYEYFKFFAGTEDINGELLQLHDDGATFNEGGLDRDFRVESDNNSQTLFVDGGTDRVMIRNSASTTAPRVFLDIQGSGMPETSAPASVEDMLTLYQNGSASVWAGGATFAVGRYATGGGSAPRSRLDIKLKAAAGSNTALPEKSVMSVQSQGAVGINTVTPAAFLEVLDPTSGAFNGSLHVGGVGSNRRLVLEQTDVLTYKMGGTGTNSITQLVAGGSAGIGSVYTTLDQDGLLSHNKGAVFNETGGNNDFRVESDGDTHALFVDAGENKVGIRTSALKHPLTIGTGVFIGSGFTQVNENYTNAQLVLGGSHNDGFNSGAGTNSTGHTKLLITGVDNDSPTYRVKYIRCEDENGKVHFDLYGGADGVHATDAYGRFNADLYFDWNIGSTVGSISRASTGVTYATTSDRRLKDNIEPIADGTEKLMAMNPVTHGWKAHPEANTVHGFIAQEMLDIVPEAVSGDPEGDEMMSMDYGRITPVLVAALQDAHKKIAELETRLNELEGK